MASTDARPVPIKNTAFRAVFPILDADGDLVTGATGLDSEVSKDQGTFADCTSEATEIATASGMYYLDLTSTEMNADCVAVIVKTTSSGAKTTVLVFYPEETGDINVDVTAFGGTAATASGGRPEVNTTHWGGTAVASARPLVDVASISGDATAADNLEAAADGTGYNLGGGSVVAASVTGAVGSVTGAVGSVTGAVASVTGAVGSVTGNVGGNVVGSVGSVATGGIAAASFAANAIAAAALDPDVTTELQTGLATAAELAKVPKSDGTSTWNATALASLQQEATDALNAYDPPTRAELTSDVSPLATAANLATVAGYLDTEIAAILADTNELQTDWANGGRLDLILDARASQASVDAVDDFVDTEVAAILAAVDTEVAAIKAKTDNLPAAPAAVSDIPTAAAVADAVWDETLSGHVGAGSTGEALGAAGAAGDPWTTSLPGAYGAGTAGQIIGDNLNVTVSSRASQTSVDDLPTNAELATSQAAADDATLAAIAALNNPSAAAIADAVWDEDATGHQTQGTFGQAIGDPVADTNTIFKAVVTDATGATVGVDAAAILVDTAEIGAAGAGLTALASAANLATVAGYLDTEIAAILADTNELQTDWANGGRLDLILDARASQTSVDDLPTNAELATSQAAADDATLAAIAALNNLSAAQVNAEVLDVLNTDTFAEPAQGAPAATATLAAKINYLYKAWRNKKTQTATELSIFADDATTVDHKATVSDDGTTTTVGEIVTGP